MAPGRLRVRAGRNVDDRNDKRQSAAGQVGGMIRDIRPVHEVIETMLTEAAALAARMPAWAAQ